VSKDTVAGGYGSRFRSFSRVTRIIYEVKRRLNALPSVQLGYIAALCARAGHEVTFTSGEQVDGDLSIVLTSLVDYRAETAWARRQRARGSRVGFVGLAASKMPELFDDSGDFVVIGEPEQATMRLAAGESLRGRIPSEAYDDLDVLPFPRWDLVSERDARRRWSVPFAGRPFGGAFPLMASRGCPEFCTYCPHRILAGHRARSVASIVDELAYVSSIQPRPYIVFRDPLFTDDRERALALSDEIRARGLDIRFECETRLDRLDTALLEALHRAGLAAISFGVETVSPETLRKSGRRPIPDVHQRRVVGDCRQRGIVTAGYFVFGFLQDNWESIAATVNWAVELGPTVAQFKILTPYPGTPMWKQLAALVYEQDWQQFDGYTPTFHHPSLSAAELKYLLGAAYTRFYMRPSCLANYFRLRGTAHRAVTRLDPMISARHERSELADMSRALTC
jgi:radical SAM superfamily enzyme YgiQ (UPF0313 family)